MEGRRNSATAARKVIGNVNEPRCGVDTIHVRRLQMKTPFSGNSVLDMAALRRPEVNKPVAIKLRHEFVVLILFKHNWALCSCIQEEEETYADSLSFVFPVLRNSSNLRHPVPIGRLSFDFRYFSLAALVSVLNAYHLVLDDSVTDRGLEKEEGRGRGERGSRYPTEKPADFSFPISKSTHCNDGRLRCRITAAAAAAAAAAAVESSAVASLHTSVFAFCCHRPADKASVAGGLRVLQVMRNILFSTPCLVSAGQTRRITLIICRGAG
ncbi:uncharacterized protein V6R79_016035 [Siganus canaliculatus]